MTSPTEAPASENGTVQFADVGRRPMVDRRSLGGAALSLGGVLFFVFWIGDILASDPFSDLEPHILQLLFFGATIVAVAGGIWITTRFLSTDRNRLMMTIGAVIAMAGLAANVAVWGWVWRSWERCANGIESDDREGARQRSECAFVSPAGTHRSSVVRRRLVAV